MDFNFAERLIYHQLRMVIRTSVSLPGVSLARMHELLKLAAFDELKDIGMNRVDTASHLKVVPSQVGNMANVTQLSDTEAAAPLYQQPMDLLFHSPCHKMTEPELRSWVLRGNYDPKSDAGGRSISEKQERELTQTLRYLGRQGLIRELPTHEFELTQQGIHSMRRDLQRPYQRKTERLAHLAALSIYLMGQDAPTTEAQLVEASRKRRLNLDKKTVESALAWCREQGDRNLNSPLLVEYVDGEYCYSVASNAWLTPENKVEGKQLTLTTLIDETKEFIHWVCQDPDGTHVAVKTVVFRILPEDIHDVLSTHRRKTMEWIDQAEDKAKNHPGAVQFVLNWFGRVEKG